MDALERVKAALPVLDLCHEVGISAATFCDWCARYVGLVVSMMARMKGFEEENLRLKKMYVEEEPRVNIATEYLAIK